MRYRHKMGMAEEAFCGLWGSRQADYDFSLTYSGRFKGYNANVKQSGRKITFSLSKNWKPVGRDIKIGLLQELLAKLFNDRKITPNIELYHIFMKKVHIAVPKTMSEPALEKSFERVNSAFFAGMLEKPNLKWSAGTAKLGSYDYGSDTITISRMLDGEESEMLDYVMYHEMLHKKHKFSSRGGRLYYHTQDFRKSEKAFPGSERIETDLRRLKPRKAAAKKPKRKQGFFRFFLQLL